MNVLKYASGPSQIPEIVEAVPRPTASSNIPLVLEPFIKYSLASKPLFSKPLSKRLLEALEPNIGAEMFSLPNFSTPSNALAVLASPALPALLAK